MPVSGWRAPFALLSVTAAAFALYQWTPPAVAERIFFLYAGGLVLGPSLVYPALRRRGAGVGAATIGALLVPAVWLLKETWRMTAVFSTAEAVYYLLNPLALGLAAATSVQMALCELWLLRHQEPRRRLAPAALVAGIALAGLGFGLATADSGGREAFYAYIAGYRWLFGG